MISFILALTVLIGGYIVYGRITEKVFGPDDRKTPAIASGDGVDFVPMKKWKAVLIQLLNIAGTGPIFGALMGACFGPVVFLWIVFGAILGGAVHDYMSGMISERTNGASAVELTDIYLGKRMAWLLRLFLIPFLVLLGAVFVTSPAALLAHLTPDVLSVGFWSAVILLYYVAATLLPVDKLIGRLYPVFGAVLMIMAAGIAAGILLLPGYTIPELTLENLHPSNLPVWPFMFVTVACGAISGFHATQSPIIAKCMTSEKEGRQIFYGAMILESVIALVWAAAGVTFYDGTHLLGDALAGLGQSGVVYEISHTLLGPAGGVLAIIGVVLCPITSGDTAFRSARLILAEWTGLDQKSIRNRLVVTLPLLAAGAFLTQINFDILWRYFSWSNQTLAAITLWMATVYLMKKGKYRFGSLITAIPATFMSAVSLTYILMAPEGFTLPASIGYPAGAAFALALLAGYLVCLLKRLKRNGQTGKNETDG